MSSRHLTSILKWSYFYLIIPVLVFSWHLTSILKWSYPRIPVLVFSWHLASILNCSYFHLRTSVSPSFRHVTSILNWSYFYLRIDLKVVLLLPPSNPNQSIFNYYLPKMWRFPTSINQTKSLNQCRNPFNAIHVYSSESQILRTRSTANVSEILRMRQSCPSEWSSYLISLISTLP